jgi:hypothetical protein
MTTTQKAPNTAQRTKQIETVLNHSPLNAGDKVQQECWANFGVSFLTTAGRAYLQAGQFLPIWKCSAGRWQCKTPAVYLSIVSAFVLNGRYMIRGGDNKMGSHPEIQDWEEGSPVKGQASELRFPGGVRRIMPSNVPMLAANAGNYEARPITARAFHDNFSNAQLFAGSPIELVCRSDKATKELPQPWAHSMIDMVRGEATCGYVLPIPIISSNEEEVVLKDYSQNWTNGLREMLSYLGVTEVGIMYKAQGDDLVEDISSDRPQEIYRNALVKGDLGFSTLDPDLYERMLPFATGRFDAELMGV